MIAAAIYRLNSYQPSPAIMASWNIMRGEPEAARDDGAGGAEAGQRARRKACGYWLAFTAVLGLGIYGGATEGRTAKCVGAAPLVMGFKAGVGFFFHVGPLMTQAVEAVDF